MTGLSPIDTYKKDRRMAYTDNVLMNNNPFSKIWSCFPIVGITPNSGKGIVNPYIDLIIDKTLN